MKNTLDHLATLKPMAAEDFKLERNVKTGVMIKMEEERIKVAATAKICLAQRITLSYLYQLRKEAEGTMQKTAGFFEL